MCTELPFPIAKDDNRQTPYVQEMPMKWASFENELNTN